MKGKVSSKSCFRRYSTAPSRYDNPVLRRDFRSQLEKTKHKILDNSSQEHMVNIDDSVKLSSITSIMHQFHIEYCKHR